MWLLQLSAEPLTHYPCVSALEISLETFRAKRPKAVTCLEKDDDVLLTFYPSAVSPSIVLGAVSLSNRSGLNDDFPAQHPVSRNGAFAST